MAKYRIEWTDPETQELRSVIMEFEDTATISAREWAEDWAYMAADKGYYRLELLQRTHPSSGGARVAR